MIDNFLSILSVPLSGAKILLTLVVATISTGNSVYFDQPNFYQEDSVVVVSTRLLNGYNENIEDLILNNNTIILYYYYQINHKTFNVFNKISYDPLSKKAIIKYSYKDSNRVINVDSLSYYFETNKFLVNKKDFVEKNRFFVETKIFLQTTDRSNIKLWKNNPKYVCNIIYFDGDIKVDN